MDPTLATPEQATATRSGATSAPGSTSSLPMVVWLRGDEPYCGDFLLGADDVMARLGIKRSRLTQISGQELRVGRMRQGRYVRPVYRECDVLEYQTWVRPTASHVRSKKVVEEAQSKLEELAQSLEQTLAVDRLERHDQDQILTTRLQQEINGLREATLRHLRVGLATLSRELAATHRTQQEAQEASTRALRLSLHSAQVDAIESMQVLGDHLAMLGEQMQGIRHELLALREVPATPPPRRKRQRRLRPPGALAGAPAPQHRERRPKPARRRTLIQ